jgi:hypothetical protein
MNQEYIDEVNGLNIFTKMRVYMYYVIKNLSFNYYPHIITTCVSTEIKIPIEKNGVKGFTVKVEKEFSTFTKYYDNPYKLMSFNEFINPSNIQTVDYGTHKVLDSKYLDIYYWYWRIKNEL